MKAVSDTKSIRQFDIQDLLRIMERLRDPSDGCPWD